MSLTREQAIRFVWLIGLVSLFSDMTYQGAHSNAGPYLAFLGASGTVVGLVAGAGEFVNYTLRLVFGYWVDKSRAYWAVAFPGYALNLLVVPALAFTGHWPTAAALYILERTGKGMRTPARDVMLSHAADKVGRGWAFGVHELLDQMGYARAPACGRNFVSGLWVSSQFWNLTLPALAALVMLTLTWRQFPRPTEARREPTVLETKGLGRPFWVLAVGVGGLALGYADFALIAFHLNRQGLLGPAWIPVSYGAAMGLQGVASLLSGRGFDRWGARTLVWIALPSTAFAPLVFFGNTTAALAGLALWTLGMGAQNAIMKALTAELVAPEHRGSAYGVLNSLYGLLWFLGSAAMGWLYDRSMVGLVLFSVVAQLVALPLLYSLQKRSAELAYPL